jgi:hypothetical protein
VSSASSEKLLPLMVLNVSFMVASNLPGREGKAHSWLAGSAAALSRAHHKQANRRFQLADLDVGNSKTVHEAGHS